jgi:hypothetical protein
LIAAVPAVYDEETTPTGTTIGVSDMGGDQKSTPCGSNKIGRTIEDLAKICYFFQTDHNGGSSCKFSREECKLEHVKVTKDDFLKMTVPEPQSSTPSPRKFEIDSNDGSVWCKCCEMWLNGPVQLADHKFGKKHGLNTICKAFRRSICPLGADCPFPHMTLEEWKKTKPE